MPVHPNLSRLNFYDWLQFTCIIAWTGMISVSITVIIGKVDCVLMEEAVKEFVDNNMFMMDIRLIWILC